MTQHSLQESSYLLHHLTTVLDRQSDKLLMNNFGLGFSQFKILMALKSEEGVAQKKVAANLDQTEASISRQINLMQKVGLLTSRTTPENRRQHVTKLTAKGNRIADKAVDLLESFYGPLFHGLSQEDRQQLHQTLEILHSEACSHHQTLHSSTK